MSLSRHSVYTVNDSLPKLKVVHQHNEMAAACMNVHIEKKNTVKHDQYVWAQPLSKRAPCSKNDSPHHKTTPLLSTKYFEVIPPAQNGTTLRYTFTLNRGHLWHGTPFPLVEQHSSQSTDNDQCTCSRRSSSKSFACRSGQLRIVYERFWLKVVS